MPSEVIEDRFDWKLTIYLIGCGLLAVILIEICSDFDILEILYFFALVPLCGLILLFIAIFSAIRKRQEQSLSIFLALVAYCGTSWLLYKSSLDLHFTERWLLHSKSYKAELLAQPSPPNGELRHMEWDGWGMFAQDTEAYLTYDPSNSLSHKDPLTGKFGSLHCDVWRVQRLEDHWYSVTFYTNTGWEDSCDTLVPG